MQVQNEMFPDEKFTTNDMASANRIFSLELQPEVNKIRKRILIIVGILFGLSFINFIVILITHITKEGAQYILRLISALISIVYYGFGFFVARRYSRTGLLVFAWLGVLSLVLFAVIVFAATIFAIKSANGDVASAMLAIIIVIIICFISALLLIFAVRYAFALSKLLKKAKPLANA